MIVGVDEAGRGCIIGPMVICAAAINPLDEFKLKELGVKDSKRLSPLQRERLFGPVGKLCKYATVKITAAELNSLMDKYNLNEIEAMKIAQAVDSLGVPEATIYVDSPDNVPSKFAGRIHKYIRSRGRVVAENRADDTYLIVGAASIIAKVTRDREIEKIKKIVGFDFNSGYTADPITHKYVMERAEHPQIMPFLRMKWSTLREEKQRKLGEF